MARSDRAALSTHDPSTRNALGISESKGTALDLHYPCPESGIPDQTTYLSWARRAIELNNPYLLKTIIRLDGIDPVRQVFEPEATRIEHTVERIRLNYLMRYKRYTLDYLNSLEKRRKLQQAIFDRNHEAIAIILRRAPFYCDKKTKKQFTDIEERLSADKSGSHCYRELGALVANLIPRAIVATYSYVEEDTTINTHHDLDSSVAAIADDGGGIESKAEHRPDKPTLAETLNEVERTYVKEWDSRFDDFAGVKTDEEGQRVVLQSEESQKLSGSFRGKRSIKPSRKHNQDKLRSLAASALSEATDKIRARTALFQTIADEDELKTHCQQENNGLLFKHHHCTRQIELNSERDSFVAQAYNHATTERVNELKKNIVACKNEKDQHQLGLPSIYHSVDEDGLSALSEADVDPNASFNENDTLLMQAARLGHDQCVSILLDAGADYKNKNKQGEDAESIAIKKAKSAIYGSPERECVALIQRQRAFDESDVRSALNDFFNEIDEHLRQYRKKIRRKEASHPLYKLLFVNSRRLRQRSESLKELFRKSNDCKRNPTHLEEFLQLAKQLSSQAERGLKKRSTLHDGISQSIEKLLGNSAITNLITATFREGSYYHDRFIEKYDANKRLTLEHESLQLRLKELELALQAIAPEHDLLHPDEEKEEMRIDTRPHRLGRSISFSGMANAASNHGLFKHGTTTHASAAATAGSGRDTLALYV